MKNRMQARPAYHSAIGMVLAGVLALNCFGQEGDKALRNQADALFDKGEYAKAYPMYSQLVSLAPQDYELNYRFGACAIYGGDDKSKAIGYLKFAVQGPATSNLAWYFLGRANQLDYRFDEAITAYRHFRGTADKKLLARFPVDAMEQQCRNGKFLLSNLKDIQVLNKVEVEAADFFRFYDLDDIGGKIVVTPPELLTSFDRKSEGLFLTYLPAAGGAIYFSSYGKDGKTGKDIYRSELLPTGGYGTPVKLAGYVNTPQDEDFAVLAPDGKTFYFCSKGHNSMGGYDVFKSSYDSGMDVFGAPENMDFAVNTPADELLYIVGPDGKQACFASDRDSKQGMVNVYRVGTTQTPINITFFKGTYASAFDASDRKAHIVVEDGLTREKVADVTTDMNGNYLLALPRSGNYQFLVEGGPSGLAHLQNVQVPPTNDPKVYRQEIEMVDQGGEKVVIKSYFDEPLAGDVMALAMDEIKRRARLDITGGAAEKPAIAQTSTEGDPLQAAGFDGTMTMEKAVALAQENAAKQRALEAMQEKQANSGFALSLKNVSVAEDWARQAQELVKQADGRETPEKDQLMRQAMDAKQRSQEANERARAAYRTAQALDIARMETGQCAAAAEKTALAISSAQQTKDHASATNALKELKADLDKQKGPERTVDEEERTRRAATASAGDATKLLRQANAQREDERLLNDRLNRLTNEMAAAKGGKKEGLAKQQAELNAQVSALHEEVEAAFAKARVAEDEAALARGQAALVKYLGLYPDGTGDSTVVAQDKIAQVELRVAKVRAENRALVIDPQYGPATVLSAEEMERRTFDWGAMEPMAGIPHAATMPKARPAKDTEQASGAMNGKMETEDRSGKSGEVASAVPATATGADQESSTGMKTAGAGTLPSTVEKSITLDQAKEGGDTVAVVQPQVQEGGHLSSGDRPDTMAADLQVTGTSASEVDGKAPGAVNAGSVRTSPTGEPGNAQATEDVNAHLRAEIGPSTGGIDSNSTVIRAKVDQQAGDKAMAGSGTQALDAATRDTSGVQASQTPASPAGANGVASTGASIPQSLASEPDEQAFLLANKLAELKQLKQGERNKDVRDSLDRAIADQQTLIADFQKAGKAERSITEPAAANPAVHVEYRLLEYDSSTMDEQMVEEAYPGFALRKAAIMEGPGSAKDKANMLHALEMQLVDSINAETARALALLDAEPGRSETILPQLEHWRNIKSAHVAQAAKVLEEVGQQYAASETRAMEDAQTGASATPRSPAPAQARPSTPHNDSYVNIAPDLEQVYASPLEPRSRKAMEAVAAKDSDLERAAAMQAEVDSMERVLQDMSAGKGYVKLRERTDRKIDDLLIGKVDLGQRMAFISNSEYAVAKDSAKTLANMLAKRGLPPDEPLLQMAQSYQGSAEAAMGRAKGMRKEADRSQDVVKRNGLYQQAYGEELRALRDMDRSHTVSNYLLGPQAVPRESLTYEEVEGRMFPSLVAAVPPVVKKNVEEEGPGTTAPLSRDSLASAPEINGSVGQSSTDSGRIAHSGAGAGGGAAAEPSRSAQAATGIPDGVIVAGGADELADSVLLAGYLDKFYYLAPPERALIMKGPEEGRYFLMKGRSMQERSDAEAARNEAIGSAELARVLKDEADSLRAAANVEADPEARERASKLDLRADGLLHRSDSLKSVAERMLSTATVDDAQAASFMQNLPAVRSAALMDLEQSKRRTEPVLANTRPANTGGNADAPGAGAELAGRLANPTDHGAGQEATSGTGATERPERISERVERMAAHAAAIEEAPKPFAGPLTRDVFGFASPGEARTAAIPIDAPMPEGVVYKVQVGAFRNALPAEAFSDMTPVTGEHAANGLVRYTAGMFTTAESASKASAKVRAIGYRDAFVTAYVDGKRVALREAIRLERLELAPNAAAGAGAPVAGITVSAAANPPEAPVAQLPQASPETAVLAAYPSSAEEVLAQFKPSAAATAYYNDPTAAPAKQVEVVKGLFFTVQVGVYSRPTALDKLFNITPLNSELTAAGKIRYTTGMFLDEAKASARRGVTVSLGVTDAFVTAYLNGKRIPVRDARALLAKFGSAVLVDPAVAGQ